MNMANWKGGVSSDIVAYRRKWRAEHPGYFDEKRKEWLKKHPGYDAKKRAEWTRLHPGADAERARLKYEAHPRPALSPEEKAARKTAKNRKSYERLRSKEDRYAAKLAVRAALNAGRLVAQPCAICGKSKTQGHHPDYSEPLSVIWLCATHHQQLHREFRIMCLTA